MKRLLIAATMATGFLSSASASATVVTMTASGGSIFTSGPADYLAQMGYLAKFDPDAGTLTGVSFTVGYGFSSNITISAISTAIGSVTTRSAAAFRTSDAGISAIFNNTINRVDASFGSYSLSPAAYDLLGSRQNFTMVAGSSIGVLSSARTSNTYSLASSDFAAFYADTTSNAFNVYGQTLTGISLSAMSGNANVTRSTTIGNQSISVLYTYVPAGAVLPAVPEPATWAMMLVGFGMVGTSLRHRRRRIAFTVA